MPFLRRSASYFCWPAHFRDLQESRNMCADLTMVCSDGRVNVHRWPIAMAVTSRELADEIKSADVIIMPDVYVSAVEAMSDIVYGGETSMAGGSAAKSMVEVAKMVLGIELEAVETEDAVGEEVTGHCPPAAAEQLYPELTVKYEGSQYEEGGAIKCGGCLRKVRVAADRRNVVKYFKDRHWTRCAMRRRVAVEKDPEPKMENLKDLLNIERSKRSLEDESPRPSGRRRYNAPPPDYVADELKCLADSAFVDGGRGMRCGVCSKILKLPSGSTNGRTISGLIKYFRLSHFNRIHGSTIKGREQERIVSIEESRGAIHQFSRIILNSDS
jgi:hypothetical protein